MVMRILDDQERFVFFDHRVGQGNARSGVLYVSLNIEKVVFQSWPGVCEMYSRLVGYVNSLVTFPKCGFGLLTYNKSRREIL